MPNRPGRARRVGVLIAAVLGIVGILAVQHQFTAEKTVLSYGKVTASSNFGNFGPVTVRTRRVRVGELEFEELELGPDTWVDCQGDCSETLRKQSIDFWETRRRREH